jgi:predicted RNA methylase
MAHTSRQPHSLRRYSWEQLEPRFCLSAVSFASHEIIATTNDVTSVFAADLDGDRDLDVLTAANNTIAWHENTDARGSFGPQKIISMAARGAQSVYAVDVDADGDLDVLSASAADNKIAWYENADGAGNFGPQKVISAAASGARSVYAVDVDADGDLDVLSASMGDNKIAWYENSDGKGSFGPQKLVTTAVRGARSVYAADLDGDGDMDVLSSSNRKIAWYQNSDGRGSFGPQKLIAAPPGGDSSVYAADVDGDGDVDVLAADVRNVAWYENSDGKGSFGPQKLIAEAGASSVYATDVDGDGDVDVLSGTKGVFGRIAWYENSDGKGSFGPRKRITEPPAGVSSVYAADVDGDGDVDVLSASLRDGPIAWLEQLPFAQVEAGDANRDFRFDQQDLVQVLQAAKYRTGEPATFEEGDWNGDGVFDQLDYIAALMTGNYLQGPYAAQAL